MSNAPSIDQTAWAVNSFSWREATTVSAALDVPLVAGMVLAGRGMTDPAIVRMFLDCSLPLPDPFLFEGMQGAVQTISSAIDLGEKIVVHGDYDADGITATALLVLGLRDLGGDVDWYLPNRFDEGYGLSRRAVETIAERGPRVLVTVDCGVNYPDEVALARGLGLEVVVIDHHQPGPELPDCHLVHQAKGKYPHADLCGVGLALKVMHGLHAHRHGADRDRLPKALEQGLDLVAVGTIADLATLQGENRYYVKEGLKLIAIGQRVGLRALVEVSGCGGCVDSGTVAFRLAPRLNAAGRLADPSPPLRLLLTEDETEAVSLARQLHDLNGARQDLERQILDEALQIVSSMGHLPPILVLAGSGWHEGVVGIVASRMVERYHRPTVLLGVREGVAKGSGRSIPAYDLLSGLTSCGRYLTVYGGHAQAAGLTMAEQEIDAFRRALEKHAAAVLEPSDLCPVYHTDAVIRGEELNTDTATALGALEPFGSGNPRPRLLLVDASLHDAETTRNGLHLRCRVDLDGVRIPAIGFGMGKGTAAGSSSQALVLGAQLRVDEWQGTLRPQLVLERLGPGDAGDDSSDPAGECGAGCPYAGQRTAAIPEASADCNVVHEPNSRVGAGLPSAHDLRDRPGRFSALAQVLATQERAVLLTCSVAETLATLRSHLPLDVLSRGPIVCVSRSCADTAPPRTESVGLLVLEWEATGHTSGTLGALSHAVALDPPFRGAHLRLLTELAELGTTIHLLYGEEERKASARLLRYLVHPRFAMVCLFRAMQQGEVAPSELYARASSIAWQEARVMLTNVDLERARLVLDQLGLERPLRGKAKLEARSTAVYREAEADYEECVRLCLTL
jgi:single-stranded-DNA-specific exonuclease